jgi:hypothetical protein
VREAHAAERRVIEAARAAAGGATDRAIAGYLEAAREYAAANAMDAALDACYRALELVPGHLEVHVQMTAIYLQRGWREHAVSRLVLLDRLLRLEDQPAVRGSIEALVRTHGRQHPEIAAFAQRRA